MSGRIFNLFDLLKTWRFSTDEHFEDEEIDLRELLLVLLRGKWTILAIFFIFVLVSGIAVLFVLPPVYEAKATVALLLQDLSLAQIVPQLDLTAHREAFLGSSIIQSTIEKLNLDPQKYTVSNLQRNIKIEVLSKENLLKLSVQDRDPTLATKIAESLIKAAGDYLTECLKRTTEERLRALEDMLSASQKELKEITTRLETSLGQPQDPQELEGEIPLRIGMIVEMKRTLKNLEIQERNLQTALEEAQRLISKETPYLELERTIIDDPTMMGIVQNRGLPNLGLRLKTQILNDNYFSLKSQITNYELDLARTTAQKKDILHSLKELQGELDALQADLIKKGTEYALLQKSYENSLNTYQAALNNYRNLSLSLSDSVLRANMTIVSPPSVPDVPVAPKKKLIVAVAGVPGLFVGIIAVFLVDLWKRSMKTPEKE